MRGRVLTVAVALASLWVSSAWSATSSVPSDDGAGLTLAPGNALTTPAGVSDPNFPAGNLATILLEPPATTIPFRFSSNGITATGLLSDELALAPALAPDLSAQPAWSLRDIMLSAALAPGVELNFAQGRDLAAMGAFGGGANPEDSLFLSSPGVRSPYLSLTDGGVYAGVTAHLADNLQVRVGHAALGTEDAGRQGLLANAGLSALPPDLALRLASGGRSVSTTAVGVEWNFTDWGELGVTASHSSESDSLLGDVASAPIAVVNAAETAALGISARVGFGAGWVTTMSYNQGLTQLNLRPSGFAPNPGTISSSAYGITVAKQGLFGDDVLGLSLSRPLQFSDAAAGFLADSNGNLLLGDNHSLLGSAPESDFELGYVTSFLGGSLALQANAAYQMNAGGQKGQGAVAVVSRAKINF
jgi:hypothetical protein